MVFLQKEEISKIPFDWIFFLFFNSCFGFTVEMKILYFHRPTGGGIKWASASNDKLSKTTPLTKKNRKTDQKG